MAEERAARPVVGPGSRPRLPRHVKLRRDEGRGRWVLLAPERVLTPDDVAVDVLKLCDGTRTLAEIAEALGKEYDAPPDTIARDVAELLQDMADKGYVRV